MPHENSLIDLSLPEPAGFVGSEVDLDGDVLPPPLGLPDLSEAPLAHLADQLHLFGYGPLDL